MGISFVVFVCPKLSVPKLSKPASCEDEDEDADADSEENVVNTESVLVFSVFSTLSVFSATKFPSVAEAAVLMLGSTEGGGVDGAGGSSVLVVSLVVITETAFMGVMGLLALLGLGGFFGETTGASGTSET